MAALCAGLTRAAMPGDPGISLRRYHEQTPVYIDNQPYGAQASDRGPIGGGAGYLDVVLDGEYRASSLAQLQAALASARPGETIFIHGDAEMDLTTVHYAQSLPPEHRFHVESGPLVVPAGVTLASDRGWQDSPGALLATDWFGARLLVAGGDGVRLTGLRLRGPDTSRRRPLPVSIGVQAAGENIEIDNCEVSGWGVALRLNAPGSGFVHHNFIHHNQIDGYGYGISLAGDAELRLLAEYNLFFRNRHAIAASGQPGQRYEARYNVVAESTHASFDMHGGRDRRDGSHVAGNRMLVHHNTFYGAALPVGLRGIPVEQVLIYRNWFAGRRTYTTGAFAMYEYRGLPLEELRCFDWDNAYQAEPGNPDEAVIRGPIEPPNEVCPQVLNPEIRPRRSNAEPPLPLPRAVDVGLFDAGAAGESYKKGRSPERARTPLTDLLREEGLEMERVSRDRMARVHGAMLDRYSRLIVPVDAGPICAEALEGLAGYVARGGLLIALAPLDLLCNGRGGRTVMRFGWPYASVRGSPLTGLRHDLRTVPAVAIIAKEDTPLTRELPMGEPLVLDPPVNIRRLLLLEHEYVDHPRARVAISADTLTAGETRETIRRPLLVYTLHLRGAVVIPAALPGSALGDELLRRMLCPENLYRLTTVRPSAVP